MNWDDIIIDAAATDTGMRRSNNQDSYTAVRASHEEAWRQRGHVFIVADGMGAHAVGELASKMACDLIPAQLHESPNGHAVGSDRQVLSRGELADPQPGIGQSRLSGNGNDLFGAAPLARGCSGRPRRAILGFTACGAIGSISSPSIIAWSGSWCGATT